MATTRSGATANPWPTEIKLAKDRTVLTLQFDNDECYAFPAEYLRVLSPSAEVQGHTPDERLAAFSKALDTATALDSANARYHYMRADKLLDQGATIELK